MELVTNYGSMIVEIYAGKVPKTAENFIELCEKKYYKGTNFHRLIKNFMVNGLLDSYFPNRFKVETQTVLAVAANPISEASSTMSFIRQSRIWAEVCFPWLTVVLILMAPNCKSYHILTLLIVS